MIVGLALGAAAGLVIGFLVARARRDRRRGHRPAAARGAARAAPSPNSGWPSRPCSPSSPPSSPRSRPPPTGCATQLETLVRQQAESRRARARREQGAARARSRAGDAAHDAAQGHRPRAAAQPAVRRDRRAAQADPALGRADPRSPPSRSRRRCAATRTRGVWGETQLRNVVQAAGLIERVDFDVQSSIHSDAGAGRPDMVIHLPGGKNIAVDAKVPFTAYLEASQISVTATGEEGARREALHQAARQGAPQPHRHAREQGLLGWARRLPRARDRVHPERIARVVGAWRPTRRSWTTRSASGSPSPRP